LDNSLPLSKDTIERALKNLTKAKVIIKHPQHKTHYAFAVSFVHPKTAPKADEQVAAEVNTLAAEFHSEAAEFHTKAADFHSNDESCSTTHSKTNTHEA